MFDDAYDDIFNTFTSLGLLLWVELDEIRSIPRVNVTRTPVSWAERCRLFLTLAGSQGSIQKC